VAVFVEREGRELEPSLSGVERAAQRDVTLTNSAVVAFYLRDNGPVVDRPFGLGRGREDPLCRNGCAIVEDNRVAGGIRPGEGQKLRTGPYSIRLR